MKKQLIFCTGMVIGLTSCGVSNNPSVVIKDKTILNTPVISIDSKYKVSCTAIENAASYVLEYLNEEKNRVDRVNVESFPYTLNFTESGVYSVRVAALPSENSIYCQSKYSDYIQVISPIKDNLSAPKGLKVVNNNTVVFDKVLHSSKYQLSIDDKIYELKDNAFKYNFLPGTSYKIKVKACIEDNIFFASSDWSNETDFKYTISLTKPTNLTISNTGELNWSCTTYIEEAGFTIKATKKDNGEVSEFTSFATSAYSTRLPQGSYDISVKANGYNDNPGSEYSSSVSVKLDYSYYFNGPTIANTFTTFNNVQASYLGTSNTTSIKCKEGWGGLMTSAVAVDFDKNPVLQIDYDEIGFGYMGAYYYDGNNFALPTFFYQNDCYLNEKAYDVTLIYDMKKTADGYAHSRATGVVNDMYISIGFTGAPSVSSNDREVSKLSSVKIIYVTVL